MGSLFYCYVIESVVVINGGRNDVMAIVSKGDVVVSASAAITREFCTLSNP
jgi:hypothetical protein